MVWYGTKNKFIYRYGTKSDFKPPPPVVTSPRKQDNECESLLNIDQVLFITSS